MTTARMGELAALDNPLPLDDPWLAGVRAAQDIARTQPPKAPPAGNNAMGALLGMGRAGDIIEPALSGAAQHTADYFMTPGRRLWGQGPSDPGFVGKNPYPPDSEEADFYDRANQAQANQWGIGTGFGMALDPALFASRGTIGSGGGRIVQPAPEALAARRALPEAEGIAVKGAHAYHSSPHDFDRFDFSKIGAGQGAQSYGHGIYSAESPEVSGRGGQYWSEFLRRFGGPEADAAEILRANKFDRAKAVDEIRRRGEKDAAEMLRANKFDRTMAVDEIRRTRANDTHSAEMLRLLESGKPVGPRTYVVDINAKPETMINWDAPMRDQPAAFLNYPGALDAARREAANRMLSATTANRADELYRMSQDPLSAPGELAYQNLLFQRRLKAGFAEGKPALSRDLREADIPGIQYLDAGSRYRPSDAPPTHNFVKFDDNIDILRKLALIGGAVPTAGAMGSLARQDNPQRGD